MILHGMWCTCVSSYYLLLLYYYYFILSADFSKSALNEYISVLFFSHHRSKYAICQRFGQFRRTTKEKKSLPSVVLQLRGNNYSHCLAHSRMTIMKSIHPLLPPSTTTLPPLNIEESTTYFYKKTSIRKSNWLGSLTSIPYTSCHLGDIEHFTYCLCSLSPQWTTVKWV